MRRVALLALWLLPLVAQAQEAQRAARLKAEADQAYLAGDYERALSLLRDAYDADPEPGYIANQALVLEKLEEYEEAADALERFLATRPPADKAARARQVLHRLKPQVEVVSDPPGVAVMTIGDATRFLGTTPLRARLVVGEYTLALQLEGWEAAEVPLRVEPGRVTTVRHTMVRPARRPAAPAAAAPTPAPVPVAPIRARGFGTRSAVGWAVLGGGVLAGGASAVFYALGSDAIDARDAAETSARWDAHQGDAETWNTSYLVAAGVAGAAVVAGVVLLTVGGDDDSTARVGVGPGGLSVAGGW